MENKTIRIKAPAKINLSLDIIGRKENGYHLLEMVMQSIDLYDTVCISAKKADGFTVQVSCDRDGIPTDERNIVYKAAAAFLKGETYAITIDIHKEIPDQAGMAGGSADAAAVLYGLNQLFDNRYDDKTLREIGLTVGADVPYCLHGGTAFVSGIGEEIKALPALTQGYIVGARPKVGISTKAAYQSFDDANPGVVCLPSSPKTKQILSAVEQGDLSRIGEGLFNVFEDVCAVEQVQQLKNELLSYGACGALMTGSGSAVYGIFSRQADAKNAYELLKKNWPDAFFAAICGNLSKVD